MPLNPSLIVTIKPTLAVARTLLSFLICHWHSQIHIRAKSCPVTWMTTSTFCMIAMAEQQEVNEKEWRDGGMEEGRKEGKKEENDGH